MYTPWRRVEAGVASGFRFGYCVQIVCNGNLHWSVYDSNQNKRICGFDVETECFSILSFPTQGDKGGDLFVLRYCLCYSYMVDGEIIIWLMKEYQVDESWTIEYKFSTIESDFGWNYMCVDPIKLFKDGDVLMLVGEEYKT